jgi:two-component system chemotaxis sensor kinase CheA
MSNLDKQGGSTGGIDMSQFFQVFFDEAAEHLAEMENLLLSIDPDSASSEELNAIFRAAHSIKGGSGTFGFTNMTEVTHELESLLDKVRKNEMTLTTDMVDALLASGDVLKLQLAKHRGEPGAEEPDATAVCARIRSLLHARPTTVTERELELSFDIPADEKDLAAVDNAVAELKTLAKITADEAREGRRCLRLVTASEDAALGNPFAFVIAPEGIRIEPVHAGATAKQAAKPAPTEAAYGLFDDEPAPATAAPDPGYGLFADAPGAAPAAPTSVGRRATDKPEVIAGRAGRRGDDKVVVNPNADNASIRVSVEKVDQLINQVGELVITQAMLAQTTAGLDPIQFQRMLSGMADLERATRGLQESVMSIRMMPIAFVFNRFPRMVRDLAAKLGKKVQLTMQGEGTELDKGLIEKISDPLTHLVRNSVDHGIESCEQRVAAGKPELGTVTLRASHQSGNIVVEVIDDGAGLSRERILAKARERGFPVSDDMSDQDVWMLIFEAGFSTADVVTDISGRGVGMDVVKRNIQALGGTVEIDSAPGAGTRMSVRLPLTLAIMDGMSVAVGSEIYILPLASVIESLQVKEGQVQSVAGKGLVVEVRQEFLPVVSLHEVFPTGPAVGDRASGIMVIVEAEGVKSALLVDELVGQHQVVVKSLEANYKRVAGVSGATIMGDGHVALILDVPTLVRRNRGAP